MVGDGMLGGAIAVAVVLAGPILGVGIRYVLERRGLGAAKHEGILFRVGTAALLAFGAAAFVAVALTRPGAWLVGTARVDAPALAALADTVLVVGLVEVGLGGLQRSLEPVHRATRGPGYEYPQRNRRVLRVVRLCALGAVALPAILTTAGVATVGPLETSAWAVTVLAMMRVALFPAVENGGLYVRSPTDEERARITACCERVGLAPARIVIYTGTQRATGIYHGGFGEGRTVRLPEGLLDVDDDTLAVALAQAEGRYRNRYRMFAQVMSYGSFVGIVGLVGGVLSILDLPVGRTVGGTLGFVAVAAVGILVFGATNRLARRRAFAADRFASEHLGAETVRDAYHRHGDTMCELPQNVAPEENSLGRRLRYEPMMIDRIARLDAPQRDDDPPYAGPDTEQVSGQRAGSRREQSRRSARASADTTEEAEERRDGVGERDNTGENPHAPPDLGGSRGAGERRDGRR